MSLSLKLTILVAAIVASFFGGVHYANMDWQIKEDKAKQEAHAQYIAHVEQIDSLHIELNKANHDAKTKNDQLRTAIRDGAYSLYIPNSQTGDPSSGAAKEGTRIDPTTADSLISITEDGDKAIRELNMCIDAYNSLR